MDSCVYFVNHISYTFGCNSALEKSNALRCTFYCLCLSHAEIKKRSFKCQLLLCDDSVENEVIQLWLPITCDTYINTSYRNTFCEVCPLVTLCVFCEERYVILMIKCHVKRRLFLRLVWLNRIVLCCRMPGKPAATPLCHRYDSWTGNIQTLKKSVSVRSNLVSGRPCDQFKKQQSQNAASSDLLLLFIRVYPVQ